MADNAPSGNDAPVDLNWLRECTDNDADAMKTLLDLYFSRTATQLVELDKAIATGSASDVRRLAHACSGSSGTCGMVTLAPLFKSLEKMGADATLDGAAAIAAQAHQEFARAGAFVSGMRKGEN